jgi:PST family polysaccharide transporter
VSAGTTERRLLRSGGAALLSQLFRVGVTFATHLLLRRLVLPGDWGLWHWSEPIFLVLGAVRDLGLPAHTLRLRPRPYGNLLAVEAGWGALLVLLAFVAAPLLALGYAEPNPDVVPVVRALALFLLFEGLGKVARVYFEGELELRSVLPAEILRNLAYAATSLTLAARGHGVWSLVVAYVAAAALHAALLWARAFRRIPLRFERGRTLALVREGLPVGLISILLLLVAYIDPLILAARFHGEVVGTYGFAYFIAFLASSVLIEPVGRVHYPAIVALRDDPGRAFEAYRLATLLVLAVEVPVALALFVNAETALLLLGGERWLPAAPFLRILCFAPLADPFGRFGGDLLLARHRERTWALAAAATLAWFAAAGIAATALLGPRGMALVDLLPLGSLLLLRGVRRVDPQGFARLGRDLAFVYLVPAPLFLAAQLLGGAQPGARLAWSAAAAALTAALYLWRLGGTFARFFRGEAAPPR